MCGGACTWWVGKQRDEASCQNAARGLEWILGIETTKNRDLGPVQIGLKAESGWSRKGKTRRLSFVSSMLPFHSLALGPPQITFFVSCVGHRRPNPKAAI